MFLKQDTFLDMSQHTSRVRALYKALLKLHRGLPLEIKAIGTQYMKEEFHAHKTAKPKEAVIFIDEWTKYYVTLAKQLGQRKKKPEIGMDLSPEMLDNFSEEQLGQLHELFQETTKTNADNTNKR